ncbi:GDSL-type esterase/lipase family protein [Streptomyces albidochromogenes]|uniref:GDSL-type esterase/lipase family protein n=1 Tax=Streptomyces albidochromogenes TaxID=329524 RepID=A0ABW6FGX5_9ACTN
MATSAALALLAAVPPTSRAAGPETPQETRTLWGHKAVSLGDSFISGEAGRWRGNTNMRETSDTDMFGTDMAAEGCKKDGTGCKKHPEKVYVDNSYVNPTNQENNGCHRSKWAEIQTADLDLRHRVNLACSGAKTENLLRNGKRFKGQELQIKSLEKEAKGGHVRLIVLSISGNDLDFEPILTDCAWSYLEWVKPYCKKSWDEKVKEKLAAEVPANVANVIDDIQEVMKKEHKPGEYRLVVQSYPSPLPPAKEYKYKEKYSRYYKGGCPFYDEDTTWARTALVQGISSMLRKVAHEKEVDFLDLKDAFAGHEVCSDHTTQAGEGNTSRNPLSDRDAEWVRFLSKGVLWTQGQREESFHPNYYGQQALGVCLTRFYHEIKKQDGPREGACVSPGPQSRVQDMELRGIDS